MRAMVTASRRRARAHARGGDDRGAASVEYVAAILISSVLILAVIAAVLTQPGIRAQAERAICLVLTLGQGDCGGAPTDSTLDRTPSEPCIVSGDGAERSFTVGVIAFVEGNDLWLVEQLGDGRYRITQGVGGAVGAEAGVGGKIELTINDQSYGGSAGLSGMAKLGLQTGNIFYANSAEEAAEIQERIVYEQSSLAPVIWLGDRFGIGPDPLPVPDTTWVEAGIDAEGEASVEAGPASAAAAASLEAAIGKQYNKDGTSTVYLSGTVSGEVSASVGVSLIPESKGKHVKPRELDLSAFELSAGASGEIGATVQVDYDDAGQATAVRVTSTMGWSAEAKATLLGQGPEGSLGSTSDTTLELPITSDADRGIAADMLAALGIPYVPGLSDGVRAPGLLTGPQDYMDAATAFGEAARDRGRIWVDSYEHDESTEFGLKLEVALEAKVKLGGDYVTSTRRGLGQKYFDGTGWAERDGCAA